MDGWSTTTTPSRPARQPCAAGSRFPYAPTDRRARLLWRGLELLDRTLDEGDGGVVPGGDAERILDGEHLGDAGHQQKGRIRRHLIRGDAGGGQRGGQSVELRGPPALGIARDLGANRLAVVCQRDELDHERSAVRVAVELPQRAQRPVRSQGPLEAGEVLVRATPEDLDEQVVHGAEEVGDQFRLGAAPPADPGGGDPALAPPARKRSRGG